LARRGTTLRSAQEGLTEYEMTLLQVGLDDKYRFEAKRIYLSGVQALARLPMLQRERDRTAGLNTAGSSPATAARRLACTTTRCGVPNPSCKRMISLSFPG
jgi:hypothetical protein